MVQIHPPQPPQTLAILWIFGPPPLGGGRAFWRRVRTKSAPRRRGLPGSRVGVMGRAGRRAGPAGVPATPPPVPAVRGASQIAQGGPWSAGAGRRPGRAWRRPAGLVGGVLAVVVRARAVGG